MKSSLIRKININASFINNYVYFLANNSSSVRRAGTSRFSSSEDSDDNRFDSRGRSSGAGARGNTSARGVPTSHSSNSFGSYDSASVKILLFYII